MVNLTVLGGQARETSVKLSHELARLDGVASVTPFKTMLAPAVAAGLLGTVVVANYKRATAANKRKALIRDLCVAGGVLGGLLAGQAFFKTAAAKSIIRGISQLLGRDLPAEFQTGAGEAGKDLAHRIGDLFKTTIRDNGVVDFVKLESLALGSVAGGIGGGILGDTLNHEDLHKTIPQKINEGLFQFINNITFVTLAMLALATGGKVIGKQLMKNTALRGKMEENVLATAKTLAEKENGHLTLVPKNLTRRVAEMLSSEGGNPARFQASLGSYLHQELSSTASERINQFVHALGDVFSYGSKKDILKKVQQFYGDQMKQDLKVIASQKSLGHITDPAIRQTIARLAQLRAENRGELFGVGVGLLTGLMGGLWTSNQVNESLSQQNGRSLALGGTYFSPAIAWYQGKGRSAPGTPWYENVFNVQNWPNLLYLAGARSLESLIVLFYAISGYFAGTAGTDYSAAAPAVNMALYTGNTPLRRDSRVFNPFTHPVG